MKVKFGNHIIDVKKVKVKPCCKIPDIVTELYQNPGGGKGLMKPTFRKRKCKNCGKVL